MTAGSGHSPQLQTHPVKNMKAAIQRSGSTRLHAVPSTKVSNAQEADFAKSSQRPKPGTDVRIGVLRAARRADIRCKRKIS